MQALLRYKWLIAVTAVVLVFAFAAVAFAQSNGTTTTPTNPGGQGGATAPGNAAPSGHTCDGDNAGQAAQGGAGASYSPSGSL